MPRHAALDWSQILGKAGTKQVRPVSGPEGGASLLQRPCYSIRSHEVRSNIDCNTYTEALSAVHFAWHLKTNFESSVFSLHSNASGLGLALYKPAFVEA